MEEMGGGGKGYGAKRRELGKPVLVLKITRADVDSCTEPTSHTVCKW